MKLEACFILSPHNWYDHVSKNKVNRPLKLSEQIANNNYFDYLIVINRLKPSRVIQIKNDNRTLLKRGMLYNLLFDRKERIYYLEHCLPFGFFEKEFLTRIIFKVKKFLGFDNYVMSIFDPKSTYIFSKVEGVKHFDAYDDWSLSPLFNEKKRHMKYINSGYGLANKNADLITANTEQMINKFKDCRNIIMVNNTTSLRGDAEFEKNRTIKKSLGILGIFTKELT